jgi:hypothetical protein
MSTQLLVNVLSVGPIAPLGSVIVPHGLKVAGQGVVPRQAYPDRASPLIVSAMTDTTISIINPDAVNAQSANFRVEYDHSIHAEGATPIKWQGTAASGFTPVYGSFSDSTAQTIPALPGTLSVQYNTVELAGGVTVANNGLGNPTRLTVPVDGIYAFDISAQMNHTGGGSENITFWAQVNGTAVPRSGSTFEIGGSINRMLPFVRLCVSMTAGQYLEWLFGAQAGTGTVLAQFAAAGGVPAIPSVIANVNRIA